MGQPRSLELPRDDSVHPRWPGRLRSRPFEEDDFSARPGQLGGGVQARRTASDYCYLEPFFGHRGILAYRWAAGVKFPVVGALSG
jgi:hypothetical protein